MSRTRMPFPQHIDHLGGTNRRAGGGYDPIFSHEAIDARLLHLEHLIGTQAAASSLDFPSITVTTPAVAAGATWGGSFNWAAVEGGRTVLVRAIRVEHSNPSHINFRVLRRAKFSDEASRSANTAFAAQETGEGFMREHLWDYQDEDESGLLHVWVENVGLATAEFIISLNERTPQ